jgi:hypothetical protein
VIDDLSTYSVGNFIPFLPASYFRLFERQFEAFWPLQPAFLALGVAVIVLAVLGKGRAVAVILAAAMATAAVTFHFQLYAELTPVGRVFGWAFIAQGTLLLVWGSISRFDSRPQLDVTAWIGMALAVFGVAFYPFMALVSGRKLAGAEYFALAPDPTVCAAVGILLIIARPLWLLLLLPVPLLWCVVSGATLKALEDPSASLLPVIAGAAFLSFLVKAARSSAFRLSSEEHGKP